MAQAMTLAAGRAAAASPSSAAALAATTLAVENMHCGNCMRTVETTLSGLAGVASARVNLSSKRVSILSEGAPGSVEPYIAALAAKGFKASPVAETMGDAERNRSGIGSDFLKRLGVAGFAAANIMLLSVSVWSGHGNDMPASLQTLFHWLSALIAVPAVAYAGQPFFASARQALSAGHLNMDVPISLGVLLATGMSLFQTIQGSEQVYFDAAVTLLFFLLAGRALDQSVRARAASAAENLLGRRAIAASLIGKSGAIERIAVAAIQPGMRLLVAAGEQIPVDGRLIGATASIDESIVTGESRPRLAQRADIVHAGTVALSGPFEIEAVAAADNSLVAEIARLMHTAEQARGRYVRLADRAARLYAPAVHILGAATFVGWMLAGAGWHAALTAAIAVLIITCPCALALAVPVVQVVATSRLFRSGVVLKTADALERLAEIDTVVLDKTGTLTSGRPELLTGACIDDSALARAAGLALGSRHPYAQAIVREAGRRGLTPVAFSDMREEPGAGMVVSVEGRELRLGSATFCGAVPGASDLASLYFRDGETPVVGLPVADALRPDATSVVEAMQRLGLHVEVLSGDSLAAVESAARDLHIVTWAAGQRPEQKIARLASLAASGRKTLMVGDGLNDAPALAAGHASLSPASAADISQMAADAVFQGERLQPILTCLGVAKSARRRALENFAIAIGYNAFFVPLAMAGRVTPLIAALAMSGSSIVVTLNALRISRTTQVGAS
jgi:P-type Cu2+ transporter